MKRLALALAAVAIVATGCSHWKQTRPTGPQPGRDIPTDCVALYDHHEGDDASTDKFAGVYCKTHLEVKP